MRKKGGGGGVDGKDRCLLGIVVIGFLLHLK
jgi:hypothetical protein